jgi:hypothetical protein
MTLIRLILTDKAGRAVSNQQMAIGKIKGQENQKPKTKSQKPEQLTELSAE